MSGIAARLAAVPFLSQVSKIELERFAVLWSPFRILKGERLWQQGELAHELALVLSGELAAEVDRTEVGRIVPGEMVGEVSSFFLGGVRSATVTAASDAQLMRLAVSGLRTLRIRESAVYYALLDHALVILAQRIRAADRRIAAITHGTQDAPTRVEPSALVKLWRSFRPGGPGTPCPDLELALSKQPGLQGAPPEVKQVLRKAFTPQSVSEGEVIFLEGEVGQAAYMVAEGGVDVLRNVRGSKAELLATLKPADQFGINALIEQGTRTASCVASSAGWLYRMDVTAFRGLQGQARLWWHENVLSSLATQIRIANAAFGKARKGEAKAGKRSGERSGGHIESFDQLVRASGYIESLPLDGTELEKIVVVQSEDQRRNPRGPKGK